MAHRRKVAKLARFTADRCLEERGLQGAGAQEGPEELGLVAGDSPAPSESAAMGCVPLLSSVKMEIVPEVYQEDARSLSDSDGELPPCEDARSQKKRKRELVTAYFNEEQEQEMVDWLQAPEQNCLLNKKHPYYIKKGLKEALWGQKAAEMGKTVGQLKKWYANMRSRFSKIKQGSDHNILTARECWILHNFEFLRPYLIVQCKKRVTARLKTQARAAAAVGASRSDHHHHHPPASAQSDADTSPGSRSSATNGDTEAARSSIAELQSQLLNKLSKTPMQRQKDAFADYMKEATYTFPPAMWLRFQGEVNSLLQKYQLELLGQAQHQQQDGFHGVSEDVF
ncbi:uncharacterized protein LOC118422417 [Branchiostoma floridae]|uniref:Uncharacterized protein LOC118422417 n=1 Tax=Branchiostoma floridae TaxID=7739 RepID=A0A9J7LMZ2_BRAFL|nr:uncharacterized protein LOC118422417 [Branchiostoma floridae]